ncbi:BgTH12-04519 [Blumeria graminis f. sp. triticale]|uniref:Bgt-55069 n=2 Tax=Blumeria graminis TaxID=34373 RepID=A0A9X9L734_BLUGR|nr:BgTH12-04519 [Blumeria graminis f. sp. triticale]VCU38970.1 Bgt-55069 [Blumeria graminis f. sp. tritici]
MKFFSAASIAVSACLPLMVLAVPGSLIYSCENQTLSQEIVDFYAKFAKAKFVESRDIVNPDLQVTRAYKFRKNRIDYVIDNYLIQIVGPQSDIILYESSQYGWNQCFLTVEE